MELTDRIPLAPGETGGTFECNQLSVCLTKKFSLMKSPILVFCLALALFGMTIQGWAAAEEEVKALVAKAQEKLDADKTSEQDLAGVLKEFDELITKYKHTDQDAAATAVFAKGVLYGKIFKDKKKSAEMMEQILKEFPNTQMAKQAKETLTNIQASWVAQKIRAGLTPGTPFPDFGVTDIEGKPIKISDYKGKVVLVDFWATWCTICVEELPNVKKTYEKYNKKGFEIIGISLDEEKDALTKFTKKNGMKWRQYFDGLGWDSKMAIQYGVEKLPTTFLLDKNGKIIASNLEGDELKNAVAKALK